MWYKLEKEFELDHLGQHLVFAFTPINGETDYSVDRNGIEREVHFITEDIGDYILTRTRPLMRPNPDKKCPVRVTVLSTDKAICESAMYRVANRIRVSPKPEKLEGVLVTK
jgi:hypothetical protein